MEKELIKLLFNKKFYTKNKTKLSKEFFTNGTGDLYETIEHAHEDSDKDLSINEVSSLHMDVYNPATTRAKKENFDALVNEIKELELPNETIASNIIRALYKRRIANKIAVLATEIYNGKDSDFSEIKKELEISFDDIDKDEYEYVTSDVSSLIDKLKDNTKWKFNLSSLKENVNGVGEGNLAIIFARPESGKTAFWVNLVAGINGFASQGAKVCALINEEPAIRTQMRLINAHTGMTFDEIRAEEKPDILVIDQLDKVNVKGNFARTDEKLRAVYTGAREIAKRNNCCVIAISQASADGHGKLELTFDMMEGSKTGKAAEADVIIGVGVNGMTEENVRGLYISKNKITGWHGQIVCMIQPELSRYYD